MKTNPSLYMFDIVRVRHKMMRISSDVWSTVPMSYQVQYSYESKFTNMYARTRTSLKHQLHSIYECGTTCHQLSHYVTWHMTLVISTRIATCHHANQLNTKHLFWWPPKQNACKHTCRQCGEHEHTSHLIDFVKCIWQLVCNRILQHVPV